MTRQAKQESVGEVAEAGFRAGVPPPRESAGSQYPVDLIRFESGRVPVSHGGVFLSALQRALVR